MSLQDEYIELQYALTKMKKQVYDLLVKRARLRESMEALSIENENLVAELERVKKVKNAIQK